MVCRIAGKHRFRSGLTWNVSLFDNWSLHFHLRHLVRCAFPNSIQLSKFHPVVAWSPLSPNSFYHKMEGLLVNNNCMFGIFLPESLLLSVKWKEFQVTPLVKIVFFKRSVVYFQLARLRPIKGKMISEMDGIFSTIITYLITINL